MCTAGVTGHVAGPAGRCRAVRFSRVRNRSYIDRDRLSSIAGVRRQSRFDRIFDYKSRPPVPPVFSITYPFLRVRDRCFFFVLRYVRWTPRAYFDSFPSSPSTCSYDRRPPPPAAGGVLSDGLQAPQFENANNGNVNRCINQSARAPPPRPSRRLSSDSPAACKFNTRFDYDVNFSF